MNAVTILSGIILLVIVFYIGKNSGVDIPFLNDSNILQVSGGAFVIFFLAYFYDTYRRDVAVLCSNIPRKCEDKN